MNDLTELRDHLFATLRALRDKESPMETDRARAISQVAATMIDSARVEVDWLKHAGRGSQGTGFLPAPPNVPNGTPAAAAVSETTRKIPSGVVRVLQHTMRDD